MCVWWCSCSELAPMQRGATSVRRRSTNAKVARGARRGCGERPTDRPTDRRSDADHCRADIGRRHHHRQRARLLRERRVRDAPHAAPIDAACVYVRLFVCISYAPPGKALDAASIVIKRGNAKFEVARARAARCCWWRRDGGARQILSSDGASKLKKDVWCGPRAHRRRRFRLDARRRRFGAERRADRKRRVICVVAQARRRLRWRWWWWRRGGGGGGCETGVSARRRRRGRRGSSRAGS